MKAAYNISKWSFFVTLSLYVIAILGYLTSLKSGSRSDWFTIAVFAIIFGFVAQFILGIIHLLVAIYVYADYKKIKNQDRLLLNVYGLLIPTFFISWLIFASNEYFDEFEYLAGFVAVVPMIMGGYFVFVLHRINKSKRVLSNESTSEILEV
jgi:hypothetical protein